MTQDAIADVAQVPNFAEWFDRHFQRIGTEWRFAQASIHAVEPCVAA